MTDRYAITAVDRLGVKTHHATADTLDTALDRLREALERDGYMRAFQTDLDPDRDKPAPVTEEERERLAEIMPHMPGGLTS